MTARAGAESFRSRSVMHEISNLQFTRGGIFRPKIGSISRASVQALSRAAASAP